MLVFEVICVHINKMASVYFFIVNNYNTIVIKNYPTSTWLWSKNKILIVKALRFACGGCNKQQNAMKFQNEILNSKSRNKMMQISKFISWAYNVGSREETTMLLEINLRLYVQRWFWHAKLLLKVLKCQNTISVKTDFIWRSCAGKET